MKTTKEIAADCGITDPYELLHLDRALAGGNEYKDLSLLETDFLHVIGALYRRIELFEAAEQRRKDMGIQTEDAKWLDPECHKGCQSLKFKQRIEALEREDEMPPKVREALAHVRHHHSNVTMVLFDVNARWHYLDEDAEAPTFGPEVDVSLLEDAADAVSDLPRLFVWQESTLSAL